MRLLRNICILCLLVGCVGLPDKTQIPTVRVTVSQPTLTVTFAATATATIAATPTVPLTLLPTATQAPTSSTISSAGLCSPLEDISLSEITSPDLLKTPFQAPRPGMDDGHHGVDLAYWSRGVHTTMLRLPIHAALAGKVAGVLPDRAPYGNAIIIETPLSTLPAKWVEALNLPAPRNEIQPSLSLVCPSYLPDTAAGRVSAKDRSLYVLYAHMDAPSSRQTGEQVACGDTIGEVGTTGNSVNPHLHFETRVGPVDETFASMAHYTTTATEDERRAYCLWRVSGAFQVFDPLRLLSLQP